MKVENYFIYGAHKKGYTVEDFKQDSVAEDDENAKKRVEKQVAFWKKEDAYVQSHT